jgi:ABC-2 type transport system permease protein
LRRAGAAAAALWWRELVRFLRQRNRVIGALGTPLVFWGLLGAGLSGSVRGPVAGLGYIAYFFPGALVLILLFTAIFSTISVIEDRREGLLRAVLVSPAPRVAVVLGKVLGGATIATGQGVLFLLLWPAVGPWPGVAGMLAAVGAVVVLAVALTALGLCIAWRMDSTAGFHAIMNLFLMPLWLLSGAVFPFASAPAWQRAVMLVNPLTYGHTALGAALWGSEGPEGPVGPVVALGLTAAAAGLLFAGAVGVVLRGRG